MAGQIFNGNINATATAWMMVFMVAFAVLWEAGCNWLSKRCEDNKAHTELLSKIAKELMILGFIAFMIILSKELSILTWNAETLHVFEFCDLLVSICVLVYVANCWVSSMTMTMTQREWDRLAMMPTSMVMTRVDDYMAGVEKSCWKKFQHKMPLMASQWRHEADFKVLQLLFQMRFHMPAHFDYVQYIKLVLQGVVVSMANLTTLHWVLIMLINAIWWAAIKLGDEIYGDVFTPDDHICLFGTCGRRRLAAQDDCSNETTETTDISSETTLDWMWLYIGIGWFVVAILWSILRNIEQRMGRVLASNGAQNDNEICDLLERTQKELVAHEGHLSEHELFRTSTQAPDPAGERIDEKDNHTEIAKPRRHLIELGETFEDGDADQVMVFQDGKDSNAVLSIAKFEVLVFFTQFLQLVIDFYLGFYFVHMRLRVSKAVGEESFTAGSVLQQILLHLAMVMPVLLSFYVIMLTTRNIALLVGVLHLNENAVSDVLSHMESVKAIRGRIQTVLGSTKIVHSNPNPTVAKELLSKVEAGELAILKKLSGRPQSDRVEGAEILRMITDQASALTMTGADVTAWMDREKFHFYELLDPSQQATAQSAHTLRRAADGGPEKDTVEVRELAEFVLRYVAQSLHEALAHAPDDPKGQELAAEVVALPCVTDDMMSRVQALTRAKALFVVTDKDNSGSVSKTELFQALRRFKVSVTQKEYNDLFRVIDPDQTHSMNMDEWIEFMTASEAGLDHRVRATAVAKEQSFHDVSDRTGGSGKVWPSSSTPAAPEGAPGPRKATSAPALEP